MTTGYVSAEEVFAEDVPMTLGCALRAIRVCDEFTQAMFAKKLGISAQNLCDIEKERTSVSPARASRWAKVLGYHEQYFIRLALQKAIELAGLKKSYIVSLKADDDRPKKRSLSAKDRRSRGGMRKKTA